MPNFTSYSMTADPSMVTSATNQTAGRRTYLQERLSRLNSWLLTLLAFSLPLSTSLLSVTALLILALWLIERNFRHKFKEITTNPVTISLLAYLGLHVVGLCWSQQVITGLSMIERQWKLALMPVFLTAVIPAHRSRYLWGYFSGIAVAALLTYLAWFGLLHYSDVTPHHLTKGTFHVVYNPLLALAIYVLIHELLWGDSITGPWRPLAMGLVLLLILDMFITEGRSGQMAFFVLMGLLVVQICRRNIFKAFLVIILGGPLLLGAIYHISPTFQRRLDRAVREVRLFHQDPNTSVGLRLLYWQNSFKIIKQHPLIGVGTGDFQTEYAQINQQTAPTIRATDNPHNQYILILCQFGLLGLMTLLSLFASQIVLAARGADRWRRVRLAFPLFFLTIMLTESYLMVYETGFLYGLFSAILYKDDECGALDQ